MAYLPSQDTVILQIAKSGSTSLIKSASTICDVTHTGHLCASAHPAASRYIAVVRDPVERLVSAINYYYDPQRVDDALRHALMYRMHQAAFIPQSWYMDLPCEVYSLKDMDKALASIGYVGDVPKENASTKWLTVDMLRESKWFDRFMAVYSQDMLH